MKASIGGGDAFTKDSDRVYSIKGCKYDNKFFDQKDTFNINKLE